MSEDNSLPINSAGETPEQEPIPNIFESLQNIDLKDEEETGKFFGKLFSSINRTIIQPSTDDPSQITDRLYQLLGVDDEKRVLLLRREEVKTFFMEQLNTVGMRDSIILTKERFNLPDDYSIKVETTITFKIENTHKTEEPNVD